MDYNLAKKLKDAGFPCIIFCDGVEKGCSGNHLLEAHGLSELIEACGEERIFNGEYHYFRLDFALFRGERRWWASFADDSESENHAVRQYGSTPEEAVANLWLALNKKA